MTIYLAYGIRHSVEGQNGAGESDTDFLIPENEPETGSTEKKAEPRTDRDLGPGDEAKEATE